MQDGMMEAMGGAGGPLDQQRSNSQRMPVPMPPGAGKGGCGGAMGGFAPLGGPPGGALPLGHGGMPRPNGPCGPGSAPGGAMGVSALGGAPPGGAPGGGALGGARPPMGPAGGKGGPVPYPAAGGYGGAMPFGYGGPQMMGGMPGMPQMYGIPYFVLPQGGFGLAAPPMMPLGGPGAGAGAPGGDAALLGGPGALGGAPMAGGPGGAPGAPGAPGAMGGMGGLGGPPPQAAFGGMPLGQDRTALKAQVQSQLEYYFSVDNLLKDIYLRMKMNEEGWVSLEMLSNFTAIRSLTTEREIMMEAVQDSKALELDETGLNVRKGQGEWKQWLLNQSTRDNVPPQP